MVATPSDATLRSHRPAPAFTAVLCGVDASPADPVAVRKAAVLAGPDARLDLLSVVERGVSESARIMLTRDRARRALRRAHDLAESLGAHPHEEVAIAEWGENGLLLDRCRDHDLLVLGSHGGRRGEGILGARTSTAALHRAPCPVLIARPSEEFPGTIMLADDGSGFSDEAARLATAIVAQHDASILVAAPVTCEPAERHRVAEHVAMLREVTGRDVVVVDVEGGAARALPALTERLDVSLLVLGSRRLSGVSALGSVSERVAHRAACSVLVVRS